MVRGKMDRGKMARGKKGRENESGIKWVGEK